jgi:NAD(P)-dependent dehydrogenase (short-subunit alcohol dehydrogenase family)
MTVTLVTGANKGLGYETARQLIERGHTVYIGARSVERGEAAATELGGQFVQLEVTDDASVKTAFSAIASREGHLDVLVNNAGIVRPRMSTARSRWRYSIPMRSVSSELPKPHFRCWRDPRTRSWSTFRAHLVRSGP